MMTVEEAAESLAQHLNDPEAFTVYVRRPPDTVVDAHKYPPEIIIDVHWIYRVDEATAVGNVWNGFPVKIGRGVVSRRQAAKAASTSSGQGMVANETQGLLVRHCQQ